MISLERLGLMACDRREFLRASAIGAVGIGLSGVAPACAEPALAGFALRAANPLRILILGGTGFLGPHVVYHALERGHTVSIFTRGRTEPPIHREMFARVERLVGDRENDLAALRGRTWDAVIDNSARRISWTRDAAQLLENSVGLYLYTSGRGVYLPYLQSGITEDTPVVMADNPLRDPPSYGVMKARAEAEAMKAFGAERTIVVRPTYIVGPADRSNRFTYWPARIEQGGEVLVPGRADDPVQYIDVRDLAEFMVGLLERRNVGTFNVAGPSSTLTMHAFVYGVHAAVSSAVSWTMVPDYDFLRAHELMNIVPWIMPVGDNYGFARINIDRAKESGLTHRPLAVTVRDTLEWWHSDVVTAERRKQAWSGGPGAFALTIEREASIMRDWKQRGR